MILSIEWLRDYVRLPADLPAAQIAHDLTMSTVEVEGLISSGDPLRDIIVAEIAGVEPHPSVSGQSVVQCRVGGGKVISAVCGAANVARLSKIAVALPGATVTHQSESGEQRRVELHSRVIRGVESMGMICAPEEIGLEDLFPIEQLIDLADFNCSAGDDLAGTIGFDDVLLEIDNKSLTHRPDLWGHYGIARELAAIYKLQLQSLPAFPVLPMSGGLSVRIENPVRCRRYTATRVEGVTASESPFWLRSRLKRVGQRPINLLVDLTNYVMLATGQPSHAFDARALRGSIQVRRALPDEVIKLLDDRVIRPEERRNDETLAIADDDGVLALAGIMGGDRGSIAPDTRELVLEVANFEPIGVRRTAAVLGVRTDSSTRFEKGLDPYLVDSALGLLLHLLRESQPSARIVDYLDAFPAPTESVEIKVPVVFIQKKLGNPLPEGTISDILARLGFRVMQHRGVFKLGVPSWRATGDVSIPEDIVEEVGRLYGYENLGFVPPRIEITRAISQPRPRMERRLKEYLASRGGMQEVVTYPWVDDLYLKAASMDGLPVLSLHVPPAPTQRKLPPSLIPSLIGVVAGNVRHSPFFRVFELARIYHPQVLETAYETSEHLPEQPKRLAGALIGEDASQLFFQAKGLLEAMAREVHLEPLSFSDGADAPWAEERGRLSIQSAGRVVGVLGVVSPRAMQTARIRGAQVAIFELDVEGLVPLPSRSNQFVALPRYPEVEYDLSILVDTRVRWDHILRLLERANELIVTVLFLEEYRGAPVPSGKKSLTVRLRLGRKDRTLVASEIDAAASAASELLTKELGAEIRTQADVPEGTDRN